jgi:hypothetical protein
LFESLAAMLSTGFLGGAYKSEKQPLMPYPCLLAWCLSSLYRTFSAGLFLLQSFTPFDMTMVQTHLCFRYAWTLARRFLPGLTPDSSAFYPRFNLLVAT